MGTKWVPKKNHTKWTKKNETTTSRIFDKPRYVPYNGALGAGQREWLKTELAAARAEKQFVAIFSHVPYVAGILFFTRPNKN